MRPALARRLDAASVLRALTITLTALVLLLGAFAAHHAETSGPGTASYGAEIIDTHPGVVEPESSMDGALVVSLAAGCVVLAICCTVAMAILARTGWRHRFIRYLGAPGAKPAAPVILSTFVAALGAPSLSSLSISRT